MIIAVRNILLIVILMGWISLDAQSKKQLALEEKRQAYRKEIIQLNNLLFKGKKEEKTVISKVENLDYKISVLNNLIQVTNRQANLLTREINDNQKKISQYRQRLKFLKDEYAAMIVKSYKGKSEQSKVMFLMSSVNFHQAFKRLQYIKQYASFQKDKAEAIKRQSQQLKELNTNLLRQKKDKQQLVAENKAVKKQIEIQLKEQEQLISSIKSDIKTYISRIKKNQQEVDKMDREIAKLIREARAESNKKVGKSTTSATFALTPEQKVLESDFTLNKGKLPWPVTNGVVKLRYGTHPSPIDRRIKIKSTGVRIATQKGSKVRAVFKGSVHRIMIPKNGNIAVMIQHGNYFSIYKNLAEVFVKQGDNVDTKQEIGKVLTSKATDETILVFYLWKGTIPQNPASWIYEL